MAVNLRTLAPSMAALSDWRVFWDKGQAYLKTGKGMLSKREKFNTPIVYNVFSMAVEGLFMGYFMAKGGLPENHTLRDLVDYSQHYLNLPLAVAQGLRKMDGIQEICSVDSYNIRVPQWLEMEQFQLWVEQLEAILREKMPA